jgi:hypothetical protein
MSAEMAAESLEIVTMAVDKHQATKNYEVSTEQIKLTTHQSRNISINQR